MEAHVGVKGGLGKLEHGVSQGGVVRAVEHEVLASGLGLVLQVHVLYQGVHRRHGVGHVVEEEVLPGLARSRCVHLVLVVGKVDFLAAVYHLVHVSGHHSVEYLDRPLRILALSYVGVHVGGVVHEEHDVGALESLDGKRHLGRYLRPGLGPGGQDRHQHQDGSYFR